MLGRQRPLGPEENASQDVGSASLNENCHWFLVGRVVMRLWQTKGVLASWEDMWGVTLPSQQLPAPVSSWGPQSLVCRWGRHGGMTASWPPRGPLQLPKEQKPFPAAIPAGDSLERLNRHPTPTPLSSWRWNTCGPEDSKKLDFPELAPRVLFELSILMFWELTTFWYKENFYWAPQVRDRGSDPPPYPVLFGGFLTMTLGMSHNSSSAYPLSRVTGPAGGWGG